MSNPGSTQNDRKSPREQPKKIKVFKGAPNKCDLSEKNTFNIVSNPNVQNVFFNVIQPVNLNIINPWSLTCPGTIELISKILDLK